MFVGKAARMQEQSGTNTQDQPDQAYQPLVSSTESSSSTGERRESSLYLQWPIPGGTLDTVDTFLNNFELLVQQNIFLQPYIIQDTLSTS